MNDVNFFVPTTILHHQVWLPINVSSSSSSLGRSKATLSGTLASCQTAQSAPKVTERAFVHPRSVRYCFGKIIFMKGWGKGGCLVCGTFQACTRTITHPLRVRVSPIDCVASPGTACSETDDFLTHTCSGSNGTG